MSMRQVTTESDRYTYTYLKPSYKANTLCAKYVRKLTTVISLVWLLELYITSNYLLMNIIQKRILVLK